MYMIRIPDHLQKVEDALCAYSSKQQVDFLSVAITLQFWVLTLLHSSEDVNTGFANYLNPNVVEGR